MKKSKVTGDKIKRMLPFTLTDAEKARRGELAANLNGRLTDASDAKKTEVAKHNAKIKDIQQKLTATLTMIEEGVERRETVCTEFKNFENNTVDYIVNGKVMESREMTQDDRQSEMKVLKGSKKPKDKWQQLAPKTDYKSKAANDDKDAEIAQVHKLETSRATANSAMNNKPSNAPVG